MEQTIQYFFSATKKHEGNVLTRNSYFNCDAFWLSWESCQQVFFSGIIRKCVWEKSALVKFFFQFIAESSNTYAHTTSCQESIGCWYTKSYEHRHTKWHCTVGPIEPLTYIATTCNFVNMVHHWWVYQICLL